MTNIITPPVLTVIDGTPTTTSTDIAIHFGKRHDDVLRSIRNLISKLPKKHARNFAETVETRENPSGGMPISSPAYRITRDGFTLLAMGFTGQKALEFKLAYIEAFNKMEAELHKVKAKPTTKALPHCLTVEQQKAIQSVVKSRVELLPENKRAKGAITCWSALKSKFGVTYKEIPESEFTEALNVVARIVLDGEVIDEKTQGFKPFKWTSIGDQHPNANHAHTILSEVKRWLNASDDPVARDLHNALTDVGRVITTATTEMQEAIVNLQIGMHYLNRFRR